MKIESRISNNTLWGRVKNCVEARSFKMKRTVGRWSRWRWLDQGRKYFVNLLFGGRIIFGSSGKCDVVLF
jgi:hypothetical protein